LINNLIYLSTAPAFFVTIPVFLDLFVISYGSNGSPYFWLNNFGSLALKAVVYGLLRSFS